MFRDVPAEESKNGYGHVMPWSETSVHSDGSFAFNKVPAGTYDLVLQGRSDTVPHSPYYC